MATSPARTAGGRSAHARATAVSSEVFPIGGTAVVEAMLPDLLPPDWETGVFPLEISGCSSPALPIRRFCRASRSSASARKTPVKSESFGDFREFVRTDADACCAVQTQTVGRRGLIGPLLSEYRWSGGWSRRRAIHRLAAQSARGHAGKCGWAARLAFARSMFVRTLAPKGMSGQLRGRNYSL